MTSDHEHDWWITLSGAYECHCGASRRPLPTPEPKENERD